jgi:hypothetical protein
MLDRIRRRWQQWRCPHYHTTLHTFLENNSGPMVRRESVCITCGKKIGPLPPMDYDVLDDLLQQAARQPRGSSVEL